VYDRRFFIWTHCAPAPACASGPARSVPRGIARCAGGTPAGPVASGLRGRTYRAGQAACALGPRSPIAAGKWPALWHRPAPSGHHSARVAGACQPPQGCALGHGTRGILRGPLCRCGGNPRGTCGAGLHRDQTAGAAGRGVECAHLPDPQRGSGHAQRGPRTLAGRGLALATQSPRPTRAGGAALAGGFVSRAGPASWSVGRQL